jgi:nitrous oxide reductase accessory protein NosL
MFIRLVSFLIVTLGVFASSQYSQNIKVKKIYPIGEKIYKKKCSNIDLSSYKSYEELLYAIESKDICSHLNKKHAEYLALYLWDTTRNNQHHTHYEKLTVDTQEKCPVCGMFLYKYPQWVSRIYYGKKSFSFDGIKDMMKFYFQHKEGVSLLLVQDYYSAQTLDAKKAYYVIGSDVYGPMGNECIAFKTQKDAKRFLLDHRGKKVIRFSDITPNMVYKLDE